MAETEQELEEKVRDLQKHVRQLGERAREYEEGMRVTRQEDEARAIRLDKQEANLQGRERRLLQDISDFEHRKRREKQLREIQ